MVDRVFGEWYCCIFNELCNITDDESFWRSLDLKKLIAKRESILYSDKRVDNIIKGIKNSDDELLLRCFNFIIRTVRFLNVPKDNWKYGARKYREKRCIYNYIYTDTSVIIIGQQPSGSVEANIYEADSYAGKLLINYLPTIDKSMYFEDSFWKDNIRIDEYPSPLNPNELIQTRYIKLKYNDN